MKFLTTILITILVSFAGGLFFPWWFIAVTAFLVASLIPLQPFAAFLSGFIALFILWGVQAMYIDFNNNHILATRVASVLPLNGSYIILVLITAFIGGLVAGLGALSGSYFSRIIRTSK